MSQRFLRISLLIIVITFSILTLTTLNWNVLDAYYVDIFTTLEAAGEDAGTIVRPLGQYTNDNSQKQSEWPNGDFWRRSGCKHWGVLKTITSAPTSAVQSFAKMDGWCLVVLADQGGPRSYKLDNTNSVQVVFLSKKRQMQLAKRFDFVKKTPWSHAARKNIAYLYAIANGAEYVWDFDEHNALDRPEALSRYTSAPTTEVMVTERRNKRECGVFNPFPFFKASKKDLWPRGLPLDRVNLPGCNPAPRYYTREVASKHIGIIQSLANRYPDRDVVITLSRGLLVTFDGAVVDQPVVVPPHSMSPMNSQATLYSRVALWSLFLPSTVHESVSDTWRSYITQALASRCDMLVAFAGPLVTRDRPPNTFVRNQTHQQLQWQERLTRLVTFLSEEWKYDHAKPTLEGALERLYVDLYEMGVVELEDVQLVQMWISALRSVGYEFPAFLKQSSPARLIEKGNQSWKWTRAPFDDVVLVGQFNYNAGLSVILHWVRRWRKVFKHIDLRGPFDNETMSSLRRSGINAYLTAGEWGGLYSPMKTMAESLRLYGNDSSIRGVIVSHDDLLFNVSRLVELGLPSDDAAIGSFRPNLLDKPYVVVYGNETLRLENSQKLLPIANYQWNLYDWSWWGEILPAAARAAFNDSDRGKYADADGGIPLYYHAQSDFVYVPTFNKAMIKEYASFGDFMFRNKVMLEVGTTTILAKMQKQFNLSLTYSVLATDWGPQRNDLMTWLPAHVHNWSYYRFGLYHPVKANNLGQSKWDAIFDWLVLGPAQNGAPQNVATVGPLAQTRLQPDPTAEVPRQILAA